jgi:hypothetical protein
MVSEYEYSGVRIALAFSLIAKRRTGRELKVRIPNWFRVASAMMRGKPTLAQPPLSGRVVGASGLRKGARNR